MADKTVPEGTKADFEAARSSLADALQEEKQSATEALHDARDDLAQRAADIASEAKDAAYHAVEATQHDIGSNLAALGGALRAASDHLANDDQRTASKLMLDTAAGVERLSSSLKESSLEEIIGGIRTFGRNNGGALLAGSALLGLALGRLIRNTNAARPDRRSSASSTSPSRTSPSQASYRSQGPGERSTTDTATIGE